MKKCRPKDQENYQGLKDNLKHPFESKNNHIKTLWRLSGSLSILVINYKYSVKFKYQNTLTFNINKL